MNAIIYYISFPFLWIVSRLPFWIFYILSDILCFIVYRIVGYRKNIVRSNLRLAFPNYNENKLLQIEREFYSHLCDVFIEVIKSMGMSKREMLKRFKDISEFSEQDKEYILYTVDALIKSVKIKSIA